MREWSPAERLAHQRRQQNEATARYRATHGRYLFDGRSTADLVAYWLEQGIDPNLCAYCPRPAEHIDHFMPRALGGQDDFPNLLPSCAPCNWSKNDMHPLQWMERVLST